MMNHQDVLAVYAAMADLTEQMVLVAQRSDWDQLVLLEQLRGPRPDPARAGYGHAYAAPSANARSN
jgi:hypothetical protein